MASHKKVLIVDDNPTNLEIIEEILGDEYSAHAVQSGAEAIKVADRLCPDVILLDIMMPGMDGYETCRRLRSNFALEHTRIIMVTAKAMPSEQQAGFDVGADDYITKPFDENELLAKLREPVEQSWA